MRRRAPHRAPGSARLCSGVLLAVAIHAGAIAQTVVTSTEPDQLSVTLYRAPDRAPSTPLSRTSAQGFALVTETRMVTLPAGPSVIRFEGVAGNIMPETAIVAGFPQDVVEKNLDAALLSPRSLYDRALGRRVLIRRTNPATGQVIEQQATIRSGADGAGVIEVAGGFEALSCSGLPEKIVQTDVPEGLSARPTLSIATTAARPVSATITLSYLAGGFDWQADYVVTLGSDAEAEGRASLAAWVTLASTDVTSFPDARTQLVAGKPNRERAPSFGNYDMGWLELSCWPTQVAYSRDERYDMAGVLPPPPPPPPPPPAPVMVTAMRSSAPAAEVIQGELGDFKLYTVPAPTTVAAKGQKQVALTTRNGVRMQTLYVSDGYSSGVPNARRVLRLRNRKADGLGLPLPAGRVVVLQEGGDRPILLGETWLDDKAVDEEIELGLPGAPSVSARIEELPRQGEARSFVLTVSNANPWPIAYEARFATGTGQMRAARRLATRKGSQVWATTVPANGTATLRYFFRKPG